MGHILNEINYVIVNYFVQADLVASIQVHYFTCSIVID